MSQGKLRTWIMHKIWLSELGRNSVLARLYGPLDEILRFLTFLGVYGLIFDWHEIIMLSLAVVTGSIFIGWLFIKLGLYKMQQEFNNQQNPMLLRIEYKLDKILRGK